mmetsp:Transcript_94388/g.243762  ORF Transcript_94388/g.243762 Transcript_94388/m.243762 type:complete len:221 (-) Transcript_94388:371-1033(-)
MLVFAPRRLEPVPRLLGSLHLPLLARLPLFALLLSFRQIRQRGHLRVKASRREALRRVAGARAEHRLHRPHAVGLELRLHRDCPLRATLTVGSLHLLGTEGLLQRGPVLVQRVRVAEEEAACPHARVPSTHRAVHASREQLVRSRLAPGHAQWRPRVALQRVHRDGPAHVHEAHRSVAKSRGRLRCGAERRCCDRRAQGDGCSGLLQGRDVPHLESAVAR